MDIGSWRVDSVIDGTGRFPPTVSFRASTPEQWEPHADLLDEDGLLGFAMGGFLLRNAGRTVLVDAGVGNARVMGIQGGAMLDNLSALGVRPEDVTDVLFTHLHGDHIGWATLEEQPVFTNATYRCSSADWHHFTVLHPGDASEHLAPAADRFELWDGSGTVLPGIDAQAAPGHTPGSTVMVVSSGQARLLLLGDVVHCPVQLVEDEWGIIGDVDPELAQRTRLALARETAGTDVPMAAAHFRELKAGRLLVAEGKRSWVFD